MSNSTTAALIMDVFGIDFVEAVQAIRSANENFDVNLEGNTESLKERCDRLTNLADETIAKYPTL